MTGVTLNEVTVSFDGVPALSDVSLVVETGEFFTLVGPSGCGKTTLLRTIAGFQAPDSGTVAIGEDVAGVPPEDRDVGVVFQDYALFPHMTVRENVAYGLRYRDPPGDTSPEARVDELLELVQMAGMGERDPTALSGGQQQRIALARALAPGPEVLLLDEPLSALDARLRERLRLVIREIQQTLSISTVYVTHDQAEALAISDRVAVIQDGHVEQVATPESLYREPATRFVAEFVGDNNLLEGTVVGTDPPRMSVAAASPAGSYEGTVHAAADTVDSPAETAVSTTTSHSVDEALADRHTIPIATAAHEGNELTVSIRPEAFSLEAAQTPATLSVTVETTEFLGDAYRIHCDWGGHPLLAKVAADEAPSGRVTLGFDPAAVTVLEGP